MMRSVNTRAAVAALMVLALVAALVPSCFMPECAIEGLMGSTAGAGGHLMVQALQFGVLAALVVLLVASLGLLRFASGPLGVSRPAFVPVRFYDLPPPQSDSTELRL